MFSGLMKCFTHEAREMPLRGSKTGPHTGALLLWTEGPVAVPEPGCPCVAHNTGAELPDRSGQPRGVGASPTRMKQTYLLWKSVSGQPPGGHGRKICWETSERRG